MGADLSMMLGRTRRDAVWHPPFIQASPAHRAAHTPPPDDYRWMHLDTFPRLFVDDVLVLNRPAGTVPFAFIIHTHPVARSLLAANPYAIVIDGAWIKVTVPAMRLCMLVVLCKILRWTYVQRALRRALHRRRRLAVAMALHDRLGASSGLRALGPDLLPSVV